jgi:NAD/NADP transhydrogenase beta subunit
MNAAVAQAIVAPVLAIASATCFILGLKLMARARSARRASTLLVLGFVLALIEMGFEGVHLDHRLGLVGIGIGVVVGLAGGGKGGLSLGGVAGPLLAAAGGAAAALIAVSGFLSDEAWPAPGTLALTYGQRGAALGLAVLAGVAATVLGILAAAGPSARTAGQPATTALAAACSGLAAAMVGFAVGNAVVVTVGGLVAAAGYALATIVGVALGRRPLDIVLGTGHASGGREEYANVKACGAEEAAMVLETAGRVVVVPGYGMAVAQAQHAAGEVARLLVQRGARVRYAIAAAAGVIPGHMNILLDEAKVPPEQLVEGDAALAELAAADVALVVGANDVVNPAAHDTASPLYGLSVLDAEQARAVFVIKRSLRPGAAGVRNPLFDEPQVTMIFGDAKQVLQAIGVELKAQAKAAA